MDIKEFTKEVFEGYFVIFFCAILGLVVYLRVQGHDFVLMRDIVGVSIASFLGTLAGFVLYSKRELKIRELIFRHFLHLIAIMAVSLSIATFMGWIVWSVPGLVLRFLVLSFGIYFSAHAIFFYQSKKLTDKMNEKLKERYGG